MRAGLPWRTWTAAETTWVIYAELCEALEGRPLRELLVLCGDTAAVAAFDRDAMGQTGGVELTDVKARGNRG